MITIKSGNILYCTEDIIGQQTNCQGYMGRGLALEIRDKYPKAYFQYKEYVKANNDNLLGTIEVLRINEKQLLCNMFGQNKTCKYKKMTDYDSLEKCLYALKIYAQRINKSVAIPYGLGCGNGGGDWNIVYSKIEKVFSNYEVTIYRYCKE